MSAGDDAVDGRAARGMPAREIVVASARIP
jgi:hypothetical protein